MNVLILGDGPAERAWVSWFTAHPEHRLVAVHPASLATGHSVVKSAADLDAALACAGVELVVVGGPVESRCEVLRRAAAEGLAIICIHPPGDDSEAYYQVALSRAETGAIVIPDLPLRLHPGVSRLQRALAEGELGAFRGLRHEITVATPGEDLARRTFPCAVDVVRALLGEIEALTASGDPPGQHPDLELLVQLRGAESRRAEVRVRSGPTEPARLVLQGSQGSLALEYDLDHREPSRLVHRLSSGTREEATNLKPWDPRAAIMETVRLSLERRGHAAAVEPNPSLNDGTRAMELSEAAVRSLRKGRTIDLHYEAISEEATFKSIMTSTGCMILLGVLVILPLALTGPALGIPGTIYLAYLIPPVLVCFALFQLFRFGIRRGDEPPARRPDLTTTEDAVRYEHGDHAAGGKA